MGCGDNVKAVYEVGAIELLLIHLASPVAGMRAAAATTLRNLYVERADCRKNFVELGGVKGLVTHLVTLEEASELPSQADAQLEALLNLQDVIDDGTCFDSEIITLAVRQAINAGAVKKLEAFMEVEDADVRGTAQ